MLASIDGLSNGRLTVGCGAGWMREEFEAIGAPPFKERGKVTDEFIDVFRELWTKDIPEFNGIYNQFTGIIFEPKPVQKPHPQFGPAARVTPHFAAPHDWPTGGFPSVQILVTLSIPRNAFPLP